MIPRQATIASAAKTISASSFYGMLTEPERTQLHGSAVMRRCAKRSRMVTPAASVKILLSGWAKSTSSTSKRTEVVLSIYGPGDLVGCDTLIPHDQSHPETVTALAPCIFLTLPFDCFSSLLDRSRNMAASFRRIMELRVLAAEEQKKLRVCPPAEQLAHVLLSLANQHGVQAPDGITIPVELSQEELAGMMGVSRSTVARGLKELREEKILNTGYRRITIAALGSLQAIVGT